MTSAEFEAAGLSFNKEGEFAKMDASGRLRRVDEYGVIVTGRRDPDRPDDISPKIWHSMRAEAKRKAKEAKRGASSSSGAPVACAPLGIAGLLSGLPTHPEVKELSRALSAPGTCGHTAAHAYDKPAADGSCHRQLPFCTVCGEHK